MIKNVAVFVVAITILLFITGCPPKKTKSVTPAHTAAKKLQPNKLKPANAEPNAARPNLPAAKPAEPNTVKTDVSEPNAGRGLSKLSFRDKCASILSTYVSSTGTVDYKNLKRKKQELIQTLNELRSLDPNIYNSWPKEDKIAFWINTYNMQMLKIITDNYPIESARVNRLC